MGAATASTDAARGSQGRSLKQPHLRDFARKRDELRSILDSAGRRGSMVAGGDLPGR